MTPSRVALLAGLGMLLTSVSVYSLTPPGGFAHRGGEVTAANEAAPEQKDAPVVQTEISRFSAGNTLTVEGRVGNAKIARTASGETFVMLEVRASEGVAAKVASPVNL